MTKHSTDDTADALFAAPATVWAGPSQPAIENVIARIEHTLDVIAQATHESIGDRQRQQYDITIIIPVYNERLTLPVVLDRIDRVMPPSTQIIIVDDGSVDGTGQWLAELPPRAGRTVIRRRQNHGKGSAVRIAIRHSQGRVVAIQDADLEYDPADLLRVIWPILENKADVVFGSRYLQGDHDRSLVHRLGNRALTGLSNIMTGLKLTDMETCHKAFSGELLRSIQLRECRFGFEPEITAKIAISKARVIEVPTGYRQRSYAEGKKIGWRDGVAALACIWKYRR